MYLRTIQRRNKDGSVVRYVQLAHNVRHPKSGHAVAQVLHSFGREDTLDRDGLVRLVGSLSRYLGVEQSPMPAGGETGLAFVSARTLGGCWALDGLWRRLGLDGLVRRALAGWCCDPAGVERVLFALVANRALDPCSKLAAARWVGEVADRCYPPGLIPHGGTDRPRIRHRRPSDHVWSAVAGWRRSGGPRAAELRPCVTRRAAGRGAWGNPGSMRARGWE